MHHATFLGGGEDGEDVCGFMIMTEMVYACLNGEIIKEKGDGNRVSIFVVGVLCISIIVSLPFLYLHRYIKLQ